MILLRTGATAPEVLLLKRMLNTYFGRAVLPENTTFDFKTDTALRQFQAEYRGIAGRLAVTGGSDAMTWRALGLMEEVAYPLPQVAQTTEMSCWVVCAALATGSATSQVPKTAEFAKSGATPPGGTIGGLEASRENLERFAKDIGMRFLAELPDNTLMSPRQLLPYLQRGPAILCVLRQNGAHAVVISAVYIGSEVATSMIRVNNPTPRPTGSIEVTDFPGTLAGMTLEGALCTPCALIVQKDRPTSG